MNFIHPYLEIYYEHSNHSKEIEVPFFKEVIWIYLKNLDRRLKLLQHRVNINFTQNEPHRELLRFGSIFEFNIKLDKQLFEGVNETEKRINLLNIIHSAFLCLGKEYGWNLTFIDDAYFKSKPELSKFEYFSEIKYSKDRKKTGQIRLHLKVRELEICAIITNNSNDRIEINLLKTDESNLSWDRKVKQFGWLDNDHFGLKFLNGELWMVVNITTQQVSDILLPEKLEISQINTFISEIKKPAYSYRV